MLQSHITLSQCLFRYTPLTLRECLIQSYTNIVTSMLRNDNKIYVT